jgi:hypothetical protein
VGPQMRLPHIKFIYPTAPTRPITVNMGMRMPGWFDISHLDQRGLQDMMQGAQAPVVVGSAQWVLPWSHLTSTGTPAGGSKAWPCLPGDTTATVGYPPCRQAV